MQRWVLILAAGAMIACGGDAGEADTPEYGETESAVVVPVWVNRQQVDAEFVKSEIPEENLSLGDWAVGKAQLGQSPRPDRSDYYGVFPSDGFGVTATMPGADAEDFDLYAAVIIDPSLSDTAIRTANSVFQFSRQKYRMPSGWTLDSIPGGEALQTKVKIESFEEFEFLFKDQQAGTYPRLLLVPMNVTVLIRLKN